jgi:hypothetical protein
MLAYIALSVFILVTSIFIYLAGTKQRSMPKVIYTNFELKALLNIIMNEMVEKSEFISIIFELRKRILSNPKISNELCKLDFILFLIKTVKVSSLNDEVRGISTVF